MGKTLGEMTEAEQYDETGNVPSDQCETPASDYYAGHWDADLPAESGSVRDVSAWYRWTDHASARGTWCRWSKTEVSARLAEADDKRCPSDCPGSTIETMGPPEGYRLVENMVTGNVFVYQGDVLVNARYDVADARKLAAEDAAARRAAVAARSAEQVTERRADAFLHAVTEGVPGFDREPPFDQEAEAL
jgi:hypothetical protein